MSYQHKPNSGTLFKNDYKQAENHPDYKGSFYDQHGAKWDLAAWIKEGQKGKFMSLKVSEPYVKDQKTTQSQGGGHQGSGHPALDDEIPFIRM